MIELNSGIIRLRGLRKLRPTTITGVPVVRDGCLSARHWHNPSNSTVVLLQRVVAANVIAVEAIPNLAGIAHVPCDVVGLF